MIETKKIYGAAPNVSTQLKYSSEEHSSLYLYSDVFGGFVIRWIIQMTDTQNYQQWREYSDTHCGAILQVKTPFKMLHTVPLYWFYSIKLIM